MIGLFENAYFINGNVYAGKSTIVKLPGEESFGLWKPADTDRESKDEQVV